MSTVKSYEDYAREILGIKDNNKLSTYEKQKNKISYQSYVKNTLAEQSKNKQLEEANKSKSTALGESAIASERARKYVNAVNKHLGIAGTGYGESKAIDIYAQEAQRRAEINDAFAQQKNDIMKEYQDAITASEAEKSDKIGVIEMAEDEENEAKRQGYVETLRQALEQKNNDSIDDEEFLRYYKEYAQYLGKDDAILKEDLDARAQLIQDKQDVIAVTHSAPEKIVSLDEFINNEDALGKFAKGEEQSKWRNEIIRTARTKGIDSLEGKVINANFGWGTPHYYLFKNGNFYKITKEQAQANGWEIIDKYKKTNINLGM